MRATNMNKRVAFTEFSALLYNAQRTNTLRGKLLFCWFVVPCYLRYLDWKSKYESY